jgi:hypothetical protein
MPRAAVHGTMYSLLQPHAAVEGTTDPQAAIVVSIRIMPRPFTGSINGDDLYHWDARSDNCCRANLASLLARTLKIKLV